MGGCDIVNGQRCEMGRPDCCARIRQRLKIWLFVEGQRRQSYIGSDDLEGPQRSVVKALNDYPMLVAPVVDNQGQFLLELPRIGTVEAVTDRLGPVRQPLRFDVEQNRFCIPTLLFRFSVTACIPIDKLKQLSERHYRIVACGNVARIGSLIRKAARIWIEIAYIQRQLGCGERTHRRHRCRIGYGLVLGLTLARSYLGVMPDHQLAVV
jgi:hypothetical protein